MIRNIVRRNSTRTIPYETQPRNRYNQKSSGFNLKPVPTQGLVHNPPASAPLVWNTPKTFLPAHDPRHKLPNLKYRTYSSEELQDMPLIYGISNSRNYDVTPEIVKRIVELRAEDPNRWTIAKLAREFSINQNVVNVVTGVNKERKGKLNTELEEMKKDWSQNKAISREDRKKRVQMWLRNE